MTQDRAEPDVETGQAAHRAAALALGRRIRERRTAAGLPIGEVARRAGISRNNLGLIELGQAARSAELPANPGFWTIVRIARALEISPGELFGEITDASTSRQAP